MALLWARDVGGTRYEVRCAGNTLRLYTGGVLHTEYNPTRAVTGSVWDLLMLPAMFYPEGSVRRVLVLGVGGGAVMHMLLRYVEPEEIVGVDLDAMHLKIAKQHFDLQDSRIQLRREDAKEWLTNYRSEPFDMIIEDLFLESNREPLRAIAVDFDWLNVLTRNLTARGCLVMNFISYAHLRCSAICAPGAERLFPSRYVLSTPATENRVAALFRARMDRALLRPRLRTTPVLRRCLERGQLRFLLRSL